MKEMEVCSRMLDADLLLEVGRQRHDAFLRAADEYRLAQSAGGRTSSVPARLRWGAADALITLGTRLRNGEQPTGR